VPDGARVLFVDSNGRGVAPATDPFQDDAWTMLPPMNGPLDLLLVGPVSDGLRPILARRSIITIAGAPNLTVPDDIGIDTELNVEWSGPQGPGDFVGLVPRGGDPTRIIACAATGSVSRATLGPPPVETELDLIYVVGATLSVAARSPVQITAPLASVAAPNLIKVGQMIEVAWTGPENDEDFLSLAAMGSPDDAYIEWARVDDGNPAVFHGPESPGSFEVRYVDGRTGDALARTSIEVERVAIELAVPKSATSGMRIEIKWTGSGTPGDFVAIARPGAPPQRFLDWSPTTVGSPLTLAAPTKPGTYEIRYLSAGGREILAHATLEIQP